MIVIAQPPKFVPVGQYGPITPLRSNSEMVYAVLPWSWTMVVISANAAKKTLTSSNALLKVLSAEMGIPLTSISKSPVPDPAQYK